jgi:hypothetical protein
MRAWIVAAGLVAGPACSTDPGDASDAAPVVDAVVAADAFDSQGCTNLHFVEVMPGNTSAAFRTEIEDALRWLCQTQTDRDLSYHSYASIAQGLVEIDRLEDMTDLDYRTALVFAGIEYGSISREEAMERLADRLYGYMWSNRIYLNMAVDRTTTELAGTLVHEVNHVVNRSDENYYLPLEGELSEAERLEILDSLQTDPGRAFIEEYRAFYIEAALSGESLDRGHHQSMYGLKRWVANGYGFDIIVNEFPDYPTGVLVPDEAGWAARPASFCSDELLYFPCESP